MKALVDQNLSHRLVDLFQPRFPGSCHVRDHGLSADDDEKIWSLARDEGFFIVTKDNDFLARALVRGHPPQVVQVCVGNASTGQIAAILRDRPRFGGWHLFSRPTPQGTVSGRTAVVPGDPVPQRLTPTLHSNRSGRSRGRRSR